MKKIFRPELLAPCGMNCAVCKRYLVAAYGLPRQKGSPPCHGCIPGNRRCAFIKQNCEALRENRFRFCYQCPDFPCRRIRTIDHRYVTRYQVSFINNLRELQRLGADAWLSEERKKWSCPDCEGIVSVHDRRCYGCGSMIGPFQSA